MEKKFMATVVPALCDGAAGAELYAALQPGTLLVLRKEDNNPVDPGAVEVLNGDGRRIGRIANRRGITVPPGFKAAADLGKRLELPSCSSAVIRLMSSRPFTPLHRDENGVPVRNADGKISEITDAQGKPLVQTHWDGYVYFIPDWDKIVDTGEGKEYIINVGGLSVVRRDKGKALNAIEEMVTKRAAGEEAADVVFTLRLEETVDGSKMIGLTRTGASEEFKGEEDSPLQTAGEILEKDCPKEVWAALLDEGELRATAVGLVMATGSDGKPVSTDKFKISVKVAGKSLRPFVEEMDTVVRSGILQVRDVVDRVQYMVDQDIPSNVIRAVLTRLLSCPTNPGETVEKPAELYQQVYGTPLWEAIVCRLTSRTTRLFGEAGTGKNTLVNTVSWLFNQQSYRLQVNRDTTQEDLLGCMTLNKDGTVFELSDFMKAIMDGKSVIIDEIANGQPSLIALLNAVLEGNGTNVPMYGWVAVHPETAIWATMNENYAGTSMLNEATCNRFDAVQLFHSSSVESVLRMAVPGASDEHIAICSSLYETLWKAVKSGQLEPVSCSMRGFISALKKLETGLLPVKQTLICCVADRTQNERDREAIRTLIRSL